MKNLKNKDNSVNFNIFKLTVKNSLHLVWTPCTLPIQICSAIAMNLYEEMLLIRKENLLPIY